MQLSFQCTNTTTRKMNIAERHIGGADNGGTFFYPRL